MMKKTTFILSFVLITTLVIAQNSVEAKSLLDKTYNEYIASNGINLSFSSTYIDANGNEFNSEDGEAYIKGDKFRLEMETMNIWFDGDTQWVLLKDLDEVNISNPTENELTSISPLALLGLYKEGFALKDPQTRNVNGTESFVIEMTPTNEKGDFKKISVIINKAHTRLLQANLTMQNNSINRIDIKSYNSNYKFGDSEFKFDKSKYPTVEVIDLR